MFKKIRILILLCILLIVVVNSYRDKSHDWQKPAHVAVYPINVDNSPVVDNYIKTLSNDDFKEIGEYLNTESKKYGKNTNIYYRLGATVSELPPVVPRNGGIMDAIIWSLKFRYYHFKHKPDTPFKPDLTLYLQYHSPSKHILTETSTALQNGRIGVVNLFGTDKKTANNNVVIAHESLHGFGATDKYDLKTGIPLYPQGYANPSQNPVLPQKQAELMAVHIPISQDKFEMARELKQTVVGELTAKEIGWIKK